MRGVGGPLLTIGDLLSDLAVDGGDDPLAGIGDASVPSSPSAEQQAGEADPSDLSRIFEVSSFMMLLGTLQQFDEGAPRERSFMAIADAEDKLVSCANMNAEQLVEKVKALEDVLERGDRKVAEIVESLESLVWNQLQILKQKPKNA
ncbi:hypothetical protein BAE44_0016760 [Dichanthelium oligosanthes]|uniref:Uncharacterized protein n=1 Tax=Dichanthelium oligosanthes TaxID=888268 RepID=A0A1E5VB36_9POAL|nr:hypothetical protein BAE44_0016760 [Dichanthelium oligosanthes]